MGVLLDRQPSPREFRQEDATVTPLGSRPLTQLPTDFEADSAAASRHQRDPASQDVGLEGGLRGCHA